MKRCSRTAFVAIKGSVFAIGGRVEDEYCTTRVEEFKVKERQWKPRAPLLAGRDNHAAVSFKIDEQDVILVCGGWNKKDEELRSCEVFVSQEDRWHSLPELRDKREGPAAAALLDGRAFVLGGHDGACSITSVEYCHFRRDWQERAVQDTKFWKPVAPMLSPRYRLGAAGFKGKIIVVGGYDDHRGLNSAEVFSPPTDDQSRGQWTRIATTEFYKSPVSLFVYENRLIAIGHEGGVETEVEELAPEKSTSRRDADDFSTWKWVIKRVLTGFNSARGAPQPTCPSCQRTSSAQVSIVGRLWIQCTNSPTTSSAVFPAGPVPTSTASTTIPTFIPGDHNPGLPSPSTTFISLIHGTTSVATTTTITAPTPARDMDSAQTCLHCNRIFTPRLGLAGHLLIPGSATDAPVPAAPIYTCRIRLRCSHTCIHSLGLPGNMRIRISEIRRNADTPRGPCTPTNPHP
ncbi:Kelch-like protein 5 [Sparganum proliferum]